MGILVPTAHFGSYEEMGQAFALLCGPVSVLARGFGLPRIDQWWNERREFFGNQIFGRKGGYKEMVQRLKAGCDVLVLSDQNVKANHAAFVDFFGIKASATKAIALAALRTGAPIIFIVAVETTPHRFKLFFERIPYETGASDTEGEVQLITQRMATALEQVVRQYPAHWFWIHRRFKTRPPGEPENIYN